MPETPELMTGLADDHPAACALRTFFEIAQAWNLSEVEQMKILGLKGRSALRGWKAGRVIPTGGDSLERISNVFGIFQAINILLPVPKRADAWMRKPNKAPLFAGTSALDRMMSGTVSDLLVVRRYLDAQLS